MLVNVGVWLVLVSGTVLPIQSVCYEPFGCFELDSDFFNPFTRPIYELPQKPERIQTKFFIYSKRIQSADDCPGRMLNDPTTDSEQSTWPPCLFDTNDLLNDQAAVNQTFQSMSNRNGEFDVDHPEWTAFIIHGYASSVNGSEFMFGIKNRLLRNEARPYETVILVDWKKGAATTYNQACANIRLVGAEIAYFLRLMMEHVSGVNVKSIHLIGHSLGAHTAGYVGLSFVCEEKIARITGLDPAGMFFESQTEKVRVNQDDAEFVDIIHSSGFYLSEAGLGMNSPTGHLDFYPNGGDDQPGCEKVNKFICNHSRSHQLFLYSIPDPNDPENSCPFQSAQCSSWKDYQDDKCEAKSQCWAQTDSQDSECSGYESEDDIKVVLLKESNSACANMGFFSIDWAETQGLGGLAQLNSPVVMFLRTSNVSAYC